MNTNMMNTPRLLGACLAAGLLLAGLTQAHAATRSYQLVNTSTAGGAQLSGGFTYNDVTHAVETVNITTTADPAAGLVADTFDLVLGLLTYGPEHQLVAQSTTSSPRNVIVLNFGAFLGTQPEYVFTQAPSPGGITYIFVPASNGYLIVNGKAVEVIPNTAPIADAGADQSVYIGATVALNGGASFDAETASQDLGYAWSLSGPVGSAAVLTGGDTATPSFVADVAGSYVLSLTVTDGGSLTGSDEVIITVEDPMEVAKLLLTLARDEIGALTPSQVLKKNSAKELCKEIQEALKEIDKCKLDHAIKEVQEVMARTDGVPLRGAVDGKGHGQDYVIDGAAQGFIYGLLSDAVDSLKVAVCPPKKHGKGDHDDDDHEGHDDDHDRDRKGDHDD